MRMKRSWILAALLAGASSARAQEPWRFAVSGDSRNCGDVVMPAIARGVQKDGAAFYWHLGDLRKTFNFDEDMLAERGGRMTAAEYAKDEWDDFVENQVRP